MGVKLHVFLIEAYHITAYGKPAAANIILNGWRKSLSFLDLFTRFLAPFLTGNCIH
jgi:hypothetical protein